MSIFPSSFPLHDFLMIFDYTSLMDVVSLLLFICSVLRSLWFALYYSVNSACAAPGLVNLFLAGPTPKFCGVKARGTLPPVPSPSELRPLRLNLRLDSSLGEVTRAPLDDHAIRSTTISWCYDQTAPLDPCHLPHLCKVAHRSTHHLNVIRRLSRQSLSA